MLNIKFKDVFPTNIKDIFNFDPYAPKGKRVNVDHTITFHKNKNKIKKIILSKTGMNEIIHGEFATQKHLPKILHRHTQDIDIFTPTPRKDAREVEKALDKEFGGDYFFIESGYHPGTLRVIAHETQESYADYTKPEKYIPFVVIGGKKYVSKGYIKNKIKEILANPELSFRHAKDRDTLNRIKATEGKYRRRLF